MCRYGMHHYKQHYACFSCRKAFRKNAEMLPGPPTCPQCGRPMKGMGLDFKAPRRRNRSQWRKAKLLAQYNILYHSCGCGGPGHRPAYLREVPSFLAELHKPARRNAVKPRKWRRDLIE